MKKNIKVSFVIPTYNEEETISEVVNQCLQTLEKYSFNYEIIIIDDGSTDETYNTLYNCTKDNEKINIIKNESNIGVTATLIKGYTLAMGEWIFFNSSDLQAPMSYFDTLWKNTSNFDFQLAAYPNRKDTKLRLILSSGYRIFVFLLLKVNYRNINSLKLFKRKFFHDDYSWSKSLCFDAELVAFAKMNGARIKEVRFEHFERVVGKSKVVNPKRMFIALIDLVIVGFKLRVYFKKMAKNESSKN